MDIKNKRIAVVTNASTALGLSVVEELVGRDFAVYAIIREETFNSFNTRLLYRTKSVHPMTITDSYNELWESVSDQIEEHGEDSGVEAKIDLLINIPVFANNDFNNLETVIKEGLLLHSHAITALSDLMSKPLKSNMVSLYPDVRAMNYSSLGSNILASSLDTFTEHTAKLYFDKRLYVDAICFTDFDCEALYETNSSQLNIENPFELITDIMHYIVEGQGGLEKGQKFLVAVDGAIEETELVAI